MTIKWVNENREFAFLMSVTDLKPEGVSNERWQEWIRHRLHLPVSIARSTNGELYSVIDGEPYWGVGSRSPWWNRI